MKNIIKPCALIVAIFFLAGCGAESNKSNEPPSEADAQLKEYTHNKQEIILKATRLLESKDYKATIEFTSQFDLIQDDELLAIVKKARDEIAKENIKNIATKLKKDKLDSISKTISEINSFDISALKGTTPGEISMGVEKFNEWATFVTGMEEWAKNEKLSKAELDSVARLRKQLVNKQMHNFPIARKLFAEMLRERMWEHNVDVRAFGSGNSTLEYVGGIFANRGNIKETTDTSWDALNKFRFKRVQYKWYKYDDEYTYYKIDSPKDRDLLPNR